MSQATILIVEDELIVAEDLRQRLQTNGYEVCDIAISGDEAIDAAKACQPDLVLMDIVLKGDKDGIETATAITGDMQIPVIYLTAYDDVSTLSRAKLTDPFGYITKPYNERQLLIAIEMGLHKARVVREREAMIREFVDAVDSITLLKGILPICSHCKNIRDENGNWASIEEFIRSHADIVFSHGICPACLKEHFPDIVDDE